MLRKLLENHICFVASRLTWQTAISLVCQDLLKQGCTSASYEATIFKNIADTGFYFVLSDVFAMPHARPEDGVLRTGLSLLCAKQNISFGEHAQVRFVLGLAAKDSYSHIQAMEALATLLASSEAENALLQASNPNDVLRVVDTYTS